MKTSGSNRRFSWHDVHSIPDFPTRSSPDSHWVRSPAFLFHLHMLAASSKAPVLLFVSSYRLPTVGFSPPKSDTTATKAQIKDMLCTKDMSGPCCHLSSVRVTYLPSSFSNGTSHCTKQIQHERSFFLSLLREHLSSFPLSVFKDRRRTPGADQTPYPNPIHTPSSPLSPQESLCTT